ncbi:hypothetical protein [Brucella anthropi]|uniref:hypothetical protein n=1 Tax=Brucella anthropi TaxID=529 RepID=UPI00194E6F0A|nr:hypothetical protein [Brucella anthropi]
MLAKVRMNRKGGHKAILERHATDNSFKVAFRNAIRAGKPLLEAIELLEIGPVRLAICKEIIQNDCMASTDHLLNAVYAVTPYSDDRSRAYRALIMAIHKLKWQLNNTGIAIISRGYRKGYSIVSVDLPRRPRKRQADVI